MDELINVLRDHGERNLLLNRESDPYVRLLPSQARALVHYIDKLERMLRGACSTLESKHVLQANWSGELVAWRRNEVKQRLQRRLKFDAQRKKMDGQVQKELQL